MNAAPNARIPWDQIPEYLSLTTRVDSQGVVTAYNHPHPAGASTTDFTSFVFGQNHIHIDNWPNVMYMLFPTPEWSTFQNTAKPNQKVDANGQPIFEQWPKAGEQPRQLLDYTILPDQISSQEDLWWFAIWRRMDPRMCFDDLTMRIEQERRTAASDSNLKNRIQTTLARAWHKNYFMIAWHGKGRYHYANVHNPNRIWLLNQLANTNIPLQLNTTRGLTPGLINPAAGVNSQRIPRPQFSARQGRLTGPRASSSARAVTAANLGANTAASAGPSTRAGTAGNAGANGNNLHLTSWSSSLTSTSCRWPNSTQRFTKTATENHSDAVSEPIDYEEEFEGSGEYVEGSEEGVEASEETEEEDKNEEDLSLAEENEPTSEDQSMAEVGSESEADVQPEEEQPFSHGYEEDEVAVDPEGGEDEASTNPVSGRIQQGTFSALTYSPTFVFGGDFTPVNSRAPNPLQENIPSPFPLSPPRTRARAPSETPGLSRHSEGFRMSVELPDCEVEDHESSLDAIEDFARES